MYIYSMGFSDWECTHELQFSHEEKFDNDQWRQICFDVINIVYHKYLKSDKYAETVSYDNMTGVDLSDLDEDDIADVFFTRGFMRHRPVVHTRITFDQYVDLQHTYESDEHDGHWETQKLANYLNSEVNGEC